jgi:hypothetical protein
VTAWNVLNMWTAQEKPGAADNSIGFTLGLDLAVGDHLLVTAAFDNLTATTPTVSAFAISGSTFTQIGSWVHHDSVQAAAAGATRGAMGLFKLDSGAQTAGAAGTVTLSGNVVAKNTCAFWIGGPTSIEWAQGPTASTSTGGTLTALDSVTPVNTVDGNLIVAHGDHESATAPTISSQDGSTGVATSGGSGVTNVSTTIGYKIHNVNDTSDDRFTITLGSGIDGGFVYGVLREVVAADYPFVLLTPTPRVY